MPPVTRNQSKKSSPKTEPYSKENRPLERRTALLDLVENNGVKKCASKTKTDVVKKSSKRIFKNDNITKTENSIRVSEISKLISEQETQTSTKEATHSYQDNSKNSTFYQSTTEELIGTKSSEKSEDLYTTAIDGSHCSIPPENDHSELYQSAVQELSVSCNPEEIFEIDQTNWSNFMYVGCYARDIFKYLRKREDQFNVTDYINGQSEITPRHRAIVVNWLISLQDIYGLNHEVLYMAVKLIDLYLMKNETLKEKFQLLASSALLLSIKIDERESGFPHELVKQSNFIYTEDELFVAEREVAKALNFDLNVPLSYVFLRRFARCMKCQMVLLTLARYILECSLLEYKYVTTRDSLKAAAALYLAFQMCSKFVVVKDFHKFTGYPIIEIKDTVISFNNMLHNLSTDLCAVKEKYMHGTFYKVATMSLLKNCKLIFD